MPKPALVRVKLSNGTEVSVAAGLAETHKLTVLDDKPATIHGRTIRAKYPVDLRGRELDAALERFDLPKTGTASEKRQRLADHQASTALVGSGDASTTNPGGESAASKEDS